MNDDMFGTFIIIVAVFILSVIGATHLIIDVRHFDMIEKQCKEQGYIQNKTVRIKCQKGVL